MRKRSILNAAAATALVAIVLVSMRSPRGARPTETVASPSASPLSPAIVQPAVDTAPPRASSLVVADAPPMFGESGPFERSTGLVPIDIDEIAPMANDKRRERLEDLERAVAKPGVPQPPEWFVREHEALSNAFFAEADAQPEPVSPELVAITDAYTREMKAHRDRYGGTREDELVATKQRMFGTHAGMHQQGIK